AKVGPVHNQAQAVMRLLKSPETTVHLVTLLEEMPVQETVDGVAELRAAGLPVGAALVNMVRPQLLGDEEMNTDGHGPAPEGLADALRRAGLTRTDRLVEPLLAQAREHAERVGLEQEQRAALAELGLPVYELGLLGEGIELAGIYHLAAELRDQFPVPRETA
ncbi:MAG: ATPase, partial [Streptomyces sp.]